MPSDIDAACPAETRKDIASKLDAGKEEAATNLWKSCMDSLIAQNPDAKALVKKELTEAQKEERTGKVNIPERMRLDYEHNQVVDLLFAKKLETMKEVQALQKSTPEPKTECRLYESRITYPMEHREEKDVHIACGPIHHYRMPQPRGDGTWVFPKND